MRQYKLLLIGPVASGKTTAIRTICDGKCLTTEEKTTDDLKKIKQETTVVMDYGVLKFGQDKKLHIYGAPGQVRFNFMSDFLTEGCLGLALLINIHHHPVESIVEVVENYRQFINAAPCLVALTHAESLSETEKNRYREVFMKVHGNIHDVSVVDPRVKSDVAQLIEKIIMKVK